MKLHLQLFRVGKYAALAVLVCSQLISAQQAPTDLQQGFQAPPESARPRVWWHWMNGNITQEGIKMDLEWMHMGRSWGFPELRCRAEHTPSGEEATCLHDSGWKDAFMYYDS